MMKQIRLMKCLNVKSLLLGLVAASALLLTSLAYAEDVGLGAVATRLIGTLKPVYTLIVVLSIVSGVGFAIAAVFKFKQHKDNPTQIPVGTPIALIFIAAALIFMPSVVKVLGESMFGDEMQSGYSFFTGPSDIGGTTSGGDDS